MVAMLLSLACVLAQAAPAVPADPAVAFVGVSVVPMSSNTVLPDQTVVVRGEGIMALGPAAETAVPEGATRIEGHGRWLMPGLADMHVHTWSTDDFPLFLANGVTTVRNMFGSEMQLAWRQQIAAGELLGPTMITAGPIIDGDPPVWPGSTVLTDPAQAEQVVFDQQQAGYDFLKPYAGLELDVYDALVAAAKSHGMRFMGHVPKAVGLEHVIAAGQSSIEHLDGFAGAAQLEGSPHFGETGFRTTLAAWPTTDSGRLGELAEACRKNGVWNCPTLVVLEKWVGPEETAALMARPEMKYVGPMLRRFWDPESNYLGTMPDDMLAGTKAGDADRKRCVRILHEHGARLIAGTDMGNPFVVAGWALHEELANFVQAGLSPYEALRAATSGAAEFMGAPKEWGVVAVGARADLLLLEANPLDDVGNAARRVGVMVRGKWFEQTALQAQLDELAARFGGGATSENPEEENTPAENATDGR